MLRLSRLAAADDDGCPAWHPTAAMFFLNGAIFGMWATQIPAFRDRLELRLATLGIVLLTLSAGTALAMASSPVLIRLAGATMVIRATALLYCGFGVLVPLAPSVSVLAIVVLLFGAAEGIMNVAINTYATDVQTAAGRPLMSSFHGL